MSYDNPRIQLDMTMMDIIISMSDGNPGGLSVMTMLMKESPIIDPDDALESLGPLISLDNLDCYGSHIWILYKDICDQNIENMLGVLRSIQLGYIDSNVVADAIKTRETYTEEVVNIDVAGLLAQVKERLPAFGVK